MGGADESILSRRLDERNEISSVGSVQIGRSKADQGNAKRNAQKDSCRWRPGGRTGLEKSWSTSDDIPKWGTAILSELENLQKSNQRCFDLLQQQLLLAGAVPYVGSAQSSQHSAPESSVAPCASRATALSHTQQGVGSVEDEDLITPRLP